MTSNTYLTEGGCCIGGYHSANGAQTYSNFEYITYSGDFSQDVSALSHEVGEWMDDPLTNRRQRQPPLRHPGSRRSAGRTPPTTATFRIRCTTSPITCRI